MKTKIVFFAVLFHSFFSVAEILESPKIAVHLASRGLTSKDGVLRYGFAAPSASFLVAGYVVALFTNQTPLSASNLFYEWFCSGCEPSFSVIYQNNTFSVRCRT